MTNKEIIEKVLKEKNIIQRFVNFPDLESKNDMDSMLNQLLEKSLKLADENHKKEIEELNEHIDCQNSVEERWKVLYAELEQKLQNIKDEIMNLWLIDFVDFKKKSFHRGEFDDKIEQIFSNNTPPDTNSKKLDTFRSGGVDLICECGHPKSDHNRWGCWNRDENYPSECSCKKFTPKKKKEQTPKRGRLKEQLR